MISPYTFPRPRARDETATRRHQSVRDTRHTATGSVVPNSIPRRVFSSHIVSRGSPGYLHSRACLFVVSGVLVEHPRRDGSSPSAILSRYDVSIRPSIKYSRQIKYMPVVNISCPRTWCPFPVAHAWHDGHTHAGACRSDASVATRPTAPKYDRITTNPRPIPRSKKCADDDRRVRHNLPLDGSMKR